MPDSHRKERLHPFRRAQEAERERELMTPGEKAAVEELERLGHEVRSGRHVDTSPLGLVRLAYARVLRAIRGSRQ